MRGLLKAASQLCIITLAVLSWTPKANMVRTGYSGWLEHAVAYAGTAVLFRTAYPSLAGRHLATALAAYAGILEIGQIWIPGRSASAFDWIAGSAGGLVASLLWRRSLHIHLERRFWFYIGPDLFRGGPLRVSAGWGHKPDAAPDEVRWRHTWEMSPSAHTRRAWKASLTCVVCGRRMAASSCAWAPSDPRSMFMTEY